MNGLNVFGIIHATQQLKVIYNWQGSNMDESQNNYSEFKKIKKRIYTVYGPLYKILEDETFL